MSGLLRVYGFSNLFADSYPSLIAFSFRHTGQWFARIKNGLVILKRSLFVGAGVQSFMSEGRLYGLPDSVGPIRVLENHPALDVALARGKVPLFASC